VDRTCHAENKMAVNLSWIAWIIIVNVSLLVSRARELCKNILRMQNQIQDLWYPNDTTDRRWSLMRDRLDSKLLILLLLPKFTYLNILTKDSTYYLLPFHRLHQFLVIKMSILAAWLDLLRKFILVPSNTNKINIDPAHERCACAPTGINARARARARAQLYAYSRTRERTSVT
jgi:hypothetical protein